MNHEGSFSEACSEVCFEEKSTGHQQPADGIGTAGGGPGPPLAGGGPGPASAGIDEYRARKRTKPVDD